jgi:hypothetical protein
MVSCCSLRSSGRLDPRQPLVRSPAGVVMHDLICTKGEKKEEAQMGRPKNVVFSVANRAILPGNVEPRRRRARPT